MSARSGSELPRSLVTRVEESLLVKAEDGNGSSFCASSLSCKKETGLSLGGAAEIQGQLLMTLRITYCVLPFRR